MLYTVKFSFLKLERIKANENFLKVAKRGWGGWTQLLVQQGHHEVPKPNDSETKASWNHAGILV